MTMHIFCVDAHAKTKQQQQNTTTTKNNRNPDLHDSEQVEKNKIHTAEMHKLFTYTNFRIDADIFVDWMCKMNEIANGSVHMQWVMQANDSIRKCIEVVR